MFLKTTVFYSACGFCAGSTEFVDGADASVGLVVGGGEIVMVLPLFLTSAVNNAQVAGTAAKAASSSAHAHRIPARRRPVFFLPALDKHFKRKLHSPSPAYSNGASACWANTLMPRSTVGGTPR